MKSVTWITGWIGFVLAANGCFAEELITQRYAVPPDALKEKHEDPFAIGAGEGPIRSAQAVLEEVGVEFGEGASAEYNQETSILLVRQTTAQNLLIQNWIEEVRRPGTFMIYTSFSTLPFEGNPFAEVENWDRKAKEFFEGVMEEASGIEFSFRAIAESVRDQVDEQKPGEVEPVSVFTDPQYQVLIRAIKDSGKFDEKIMASVHAKAGQAATIRFEDQHIGVVSDTDHEKRVVYSDFRLSDPHRVLNDGEEASDRFSLSVWDGSIVAFLKTEAEGKHRLIFCRQLLMDPGGNLINPEGVQTEG